MDNFEKLIGEAHKLSPHDAASVYYNMHSLRRHIRHMDLWFYRPMRFLVWIIFLTEGAVLGFTTGKLMFGYALGLFAASSISMWMLYHMYCVHRQRQDYMKRIEEVEQAVERRLNHLKEELNGQG